LSSLVARGPLPIPDALDIELQLADALDEAHGRGIVHRDIKSSNLMLTARHLVKVLDFGLAKFLPTPDQTRTLAGVTSPGLVLGTLSYMAPEQLSGGNVDQRADLFSSGVVLYEMLTGRLPFGGSTIAETADRILNHEPDALARYNYSVSEDVETIVRKALSKRPEFRYQTARDFYIDLLNARRRITQTDSHRGLSAWLSPIDFADAASPMPVPPPAATAAASGGIAVLNFANITANPADDWIGQGIAESLTADLTHVKSLVVVPREQIFELQRSLNELGRRVDERQAIEIGRRLGATVTVSGAYQRLGDRIRITAQVIEVSSGRQIATVKMDGRVEELFDLQDKLVTELAEGLKVDVEQRERSAIAHAGTLSLEAYESYSRGMLNLRLAGRDSIDRAIALFEEALQRDPRYVEAMVALSSALDTKASFLSLPNLFERSLALAEEAIALRPESADAHIQRGDTLLSLKRVDEAIASLQRGIRLQPDRADAHSILARAYWLGKGEIEEAIKAFEQTLRLNPSAGYTYLQLAMLYTLRGEFTTAEGLANEAIRLQDQAMSGTTGLIVVGAHSRLGYVHYRQGRYDEAIREYRRELEMLSVGDHLLRERTSIELQQKLGAAHRRRGDLASAEFHEDEALRLFNERLAAGADEAATRYYIASLYALRGDAENTRAHLRRPLAELGAFTRWRVPRDPDFDAVRDRLGL
jgi:tetratricopeptide (TPR) repeat protein